MTSLNYTPLRISRKKSENEKKKNIGVFMVVTVLLLISFYVVTRQTLIGGSKPEVGGASTQRTIMETVFGFKPKKPELKDVIEKILQDSKATYGISVKNLRTGNTFCLNEHRSFLTASLYKVWVMAVVYEQIKEGKFTEDDILKQDVATLNQEFDIATEDADLTEGVVELSVNEALHKMITVSDNYAALLLTEKIGVSAMREFLTRNGLTESVVSQPPTTTPYDMALFFEKLYGRQLADEKYTEKMISLLKKQTFNDITTKYLPDKITVAHKTGQLYTTAHDAGIVYTDRGDYVIALLSDSYDIAGAKERMAKISEAIYQNFIRP